MISDREQLLDLAVAVNSATSLTEIVGVVMNRVGELLQFDRSSIALLDPRAAALEVHDIVLQGPFDQAAGEVGKQVPIDESNVLGWVFLNREAHLRRGGDAEDRFVRQQESREVVSHIVAPLIGRHDPLGVLAIGSYSENAYDERSAALFSKYAGLAAVAIENLRLYQQASEMAIRDGLTGAYNHRHFQDVLGQELDRVKRYQHVLSLLLLDIDNFKSFNDRHGHLAGDRILHRFVEVVRSGMRHSDLIFRCGGEEFAVVLPSSSAAQAAAAAQHLLERLRDENIYRTAQDSVETVTASLGCASAPKDADTREGLIACADVALYRAKSAGRNQVVLFSQMDGVRQIEQGLERRSATRDPLARYRDLMNEAGRPDRGHAMRVVQLTELLASSLALSVSERINLRVAAAYHDLGEAGIEQALLDRPGPLNAEERRIIQAHPVIGESLLKRAIQLTIILEAVLHHHEHYDGSGYPRGLRGDEIPLFARVLAVAETFDALTTERSYRQRVTQKEAYDILSKAAGCQLDPDLVQRFIDAHSRRAPEHSD